MENSLFNITIYYESLTGNVSKFVSKLLSLNPHIHAIQLRGDTRPSSPGHLITFTTRRGEIPIITKNFILKFPEYVLSVASSGNRNWGPNFAIAADKIASLLGVNILLKFELSGTESDINNFLVNINHNAMKTILKFEKDSCSPCVQVSTFLNNHNIPYKTINAFDNPSLAAKFRVRSVPTIIVLDGDNEIFRSIGFNPRELQELTTLC